MPADSPTEQIDTGMLKRALRGAGSDAARYLPVRFVPALTSLVTVPLFTRIITPADYGAFYVVNAFLVLGARVAAESIASAALRFYWPSKKAGTLNAYVASVTWSVVVMLGLVSAIFLAVGAVGEKLMDPLVVRLVPIAAAYFFLNYSLYVFMEVLRAANRARDYAVISITATLLTNVLAVIFVGVLHWGSAGIFAGVAVGSAIVIPWALAKMRDGGSLAVGAVRRDLLGEFVAFGAPLVPAGAALWALGFLDRFVIEWARGTGEVGLYSTAYGLGEKIIQLLTLPLILTMLPVLIRTFEEHGQPTAQRMQSQFTRYFALATVPLLTGLAVIARDFMHVFTGAQYRSAYPVLGIMAAATLLGGLVQLGSAGLSIHKQSKRIMTNTLAATALDVVLAFVLVPRFGYIAAGWAATAAYALLVALTWAQSRRFMPWQLPWSALVPILGATGIMSLAVWALTLVLPATVWSLGIEGVTGIAMYAALLPALGGVRDDERAYVRELVVKARARFGRPA